MSETKLFRDDSMDFKSFDTSEEKRTLAEAYDLISNAYGEGCNRGSDIAKPFLKGVNAKVGEIQGNTDSPKASSLDEYRHFPAEEVDGMMVPEGFRFDSDQPAKIAKNLQSQLQTHLATEGVSEPVAGTEGGNEPEVEKTDSDDSESDMEPVFDRIADDDSGVSGIGRKTAEKLRRWMAVNEESVSHEEIDMEVTAADKYDSMDDVPAEEVTQLSTEEIKQIQS